VAASARSAISLTRTRPPGPASGRLIASALRGGWRENPPPTSVSAHELTDIAPLLLDTGGGAVAWWGIRSSSLAESPAGEQLLDAYRLHALQAAVHALELAHVVRALATAGVQALIVKGWTAARLYAEPGLRPYGDIDVCVAPRQHSAAQAMLATSAPPVNVDLHRGLAVNRRVIPDLPSFEEALERAEHVQLGDVEVPILAPEDHVALLCVHLLSHGAWRPLWLCDVAAAVESLPDAFDWDRCLGRSRRLATWVAATVTLAEELLGAKPNDALPVQGPTPGWLAPAVLKQWSSRRSHYPGDLVGLPAGGYFGPARALRVLRAHWVNPIQAAMFPGASFAARPRLSFQLRFVAWKAVRLLRGLSRDVRKRASSSGMH
jgi:hypothetical protein